MNVSEFAASTGIQFIVGRLKGQTTMTIQSVLFDNTDWTEREAEEWLTKHDLGSGKIDKTEDKLRYRQRDPGSFEDGSMRTIDAGDSEAMTMHPDRRRRRKGYNMNPAMDMMMPSYGTVLTGSTDDHVHLYKPTDAWTGPPVGVPEGHRHELTRDAKGNVSGFSEVDGHTHPVVATVEDMHGMSHQYAESELFDIKGVEIFKVGKWNGDDYSKGDLDSMVESFDEVGFRPPVKLGHAEKQGSPAYGWIDKIYRKGDKLLADFMDIPKKLFDMIKSRAFDTVSSEVFWNLERKGKTFRRVLKAVALLGAETPGVSDLAPLRTVVTELVGGDIHAYSAPWTDPDSPEAGDKDMNEKLAELTRKHAALEAELEVKDTRIEELEEAQKTAAGNAEKIATLKTSLESLTSEKKALETRLKAIKLEMNDMMDDDKMDKKKKEEEMSALRDEVKKLREEQAAAREEKRQATIALKTEKVTIPALRPFFQALYDFATSTDKVVKFTAKEGEKAADTLPETIVDQLVTKINTDAATIFQTLSHGTSHQREDGPTGDASEEVVRKAREHMSKSGEKNFTTAARAVLASDPDLRKRYAAVTTH